MLLVSACYVLVVVRSLFFVVCFELFVFSLFCVGCCLLLIVCCRLWYVVVCCLVFVVCGLSCVALFVAWKFVCLLYVVCCLLLDEWCLLFGVCGWWRIACCWLLLLL